MKKFFKKWVGWVFGEAYYQFGDKTYAVLHMYDGIKLKMGADITEDDKFANRLFSIYQWSMHKSVNWDDWGHSGVWNVPPKE